MRALGNIDAVTSQTQLPSKHSAHRRNPALDGLRGLAVLAVIAYHLWPAQLPGGFLGVDLFFVLSGYLITSGLLRNHGRAALRSMGGFWVRRVRRLVPAMLLMLLGATALALAAAPNLPANLRAQWVGALSYTSNWMQIANGNSYFSAAQPPYFQHLWSLAVEEQFYVLWPLLLIGITLLVGTGRRLIGGILVLGFASSATMAALYDPLQDTSALYFGTWTHGFGLFFGSAAAAYAAYRGGGTVRWGRSRGTRQLIPLLLIGCMIAGFFLLPDTSAAAYRGGMALFAAAGALLILALQAPGSAVYRLLSIDYLRWVGHRSYGLYLWHWPLLVLCKLVFPATAPSAAVLCAIPLAFLAAAASWYFVEEPILSHGFRATLRSWGAGALQVVRSLFFGTQRRYSAAVGMSLTMMVPVGIAMVLANSPMQSQLEAQLVQAQQVLDQQQTSAPEVAPEPVAEEKHHTRSKGFSGKDVTALGDSVMLASSPQLLKQLPGVYIDAHVGAQVWDAAPKLRAMKRAGTLRKVVVMGLGTNGDFQNGTLVEIRRAIGPDRELLLITAYAPRTWVDSVNDKYHAAAQQQKHTHIIDWAEQAGSVEDLASDRIHPGPQGAAEYGALVRRAVKNL